MLLSEVRYVVVGVSDLTKSASFYADSLGYTVMASGRFSSHDDLTDLTRNVNDLAGQWAMIAADNSGLGMIRLQSFECPTHTLWNEQNRLCGVGYYAVNVRAQDVRSVLARVLAAGGTGPREPTVWDVSESVRVSDSMTQDIDGIHLDVFSYDRGGELRGPLVTPVSVVQTVALATDDISRSRRFYEGLGFEELFDRVLDFPELATLLGSESAIRIHNVNLMKDGHIVPGRIEMFRYLDVDPPQASINLHRVAVPGAIGIVAVGLETDDLAAAGMLLEGLGGSLSRHLTVDLPGFGRCHAARAHGPDGETIELFQRTGSGP
jgi:catechol 2,3-dioxygenase-like lactoylglutathione lyase family enzyme